MSKRIEFLFLVLFLISCARPAERPAGVGTSSMAEGQQGAGALRVCDFQFQDPSVCGIWVWQTEVKSQSDVQARLILTQTLASGLRVPLNGQIQLKLYMPSMDHGAPRVRFEQTGPGEWAVQRVWFSMTGDWEVQLQWTDSAGKVLDSKIALIVQE